MDTEKLRLLTYEAACRMQGKLWPNGIGFDVGGWTYAYDERPAANRWEAYFRRGRRDLGYRYGTGATPEDARANATRVVGAVR